MAINVAEIRSATQTAATSEQPAPRQAQRAGPRQWPGMRQLLAYGSNNVSLDDLVAFTRQLSLLLETGNGLVPSIGVLARQGGSPAMRDVLGRVHSGLQEGKPLSDCLEQNGKTFGPMFVHTVRAGEATGALQECLEQLTRMLDIQRGLRARIREAMTYPIVLLCIMTGVMVFMMTFVLPRFAKLFEGIEDELPFTTRLLLGAGNLLHSRLWVIIPIIVVAVLLVRRLWHTGAIQRMWDKLRFSIPVVGGLIEQAFMLRLFSSLSLLLANHVPLMQAIGITRGLLDSARYRVFFDNLSKQVEAGQGITPAFQEARFLPDTVKLMVATGEVSGALDKVMESLAQRYKEDLESGVRRLSTLLEPIMLVVMGALVGVIAISFIVPIFKMSKAIH